MIDALLEVIKVVLILFSYEIISTIYEVILRRVVGKLQGRIGPAYVGPLGLLQPVADFLKLLSKEDVSTNKMNWMVELIPLLTVIVTTLALALLPFPVQVIPHKYGVLVLIALMSVEAGLTFVAGILSGGIYSKIGGMRLGIQSFMIKLLTLLSIVAVIKSAGSYDLGVISQEWHLFSAPLAFVMFIIAGWGELSVLPLEVSEAEAEIVAGWMTEFSGIKLALLRFNHDLKYALIPFLTTTLFLGGGNPLIFGAKATIVLLTIAFVHATSARLRIEQITSLVWRYALPIALLQVVIL